MIPFNKRLFLKKKRNNIYSYNRYNIFQIDLKINKLLVTQIQIFYIYGKYDSDTMSIFGMPKFFTMSA